MMTIVVSTWMLVAILCAIYIRGRTGSWDEAPVAFLWPSALLIAIAIEDRPS